MRCTHQSDPPGVHTEKRTEGRSVSSRLTVRGGIRAKGSYRSAAVNTTITESSHDQVVFQNVQDSRHLGKEEDTVATFLEAFQQLVKEDHLATIFHQVLAQRRKGSIFDSGKEVRMPRTLTKLHHNVENGSTTTRSPPNRINVANQNITVKLFLHLTHSGKENCLVLGWQTLLHFFLEPTKHKRTEDFMKLRNETVLFIVVVNVKIEPFVELFGVSKDIRHQEIQQSP